MEKNNQIHLQEIIYGSRDSNISRQISKLEKDGKIRKIASKIYTSNFEDTPEDIIQRNIFSIIGNQYPGSVLSHRSAFEFKPTPTGQLFVTYKYTKKVKLPGVTIRFIDGWTAIEGDNQFSGELMVSQRERALLENLQISKRPGPDSKTLPFPQIEEKLEQIIRINGEDELNKVRDSARKISKEIGMQKEFKKLNQIISALLTTKPSDVLKSPIATARAYGVPYDSARMELFEYLFRELQQQEFKNLEERPSVLLHHKSSPDEKIPLGS